ncbi:hypothetical protein L3X38_037558 [Prunus dulcis]|uniref:Ubiquitin-like protease family profile domain-containing protein n=1 Tax=Prunus dulcis TaxID=3755 RepID=A0AAD4V5I3_PRUDU|nr:hypothetical protein L3X38_037558 [Prunus dulcis]
MLSFATTIDNIRQRLEQWHDVLTLLSKTPFWTLIEAYIQRRLTKVECMKSNYDIVRLIQVYDTKTKKFRFDDGDSEMKSQDVSEIFGLPNRGKKLPSTTTSTRPNLHFVKKYFSGYKKITKTSIDKCLNLALEDETEEGAMDTTRLIILQLFMTNLFCNSGCTLAWTYTTTIDTLEDMGKYNWARGVLDYMYFGLEQAKKNKKDKKKQPSVSGCLILIPYWLCQRSNLLTPIPGREQMTPAAVKWSLQELSAKLHHLENNQIKIKSTKAQEPDDDSEEENEEEDAAAEEVNEEHDDAAEEVNEEHGDADEEENEEEDAEMNEEYDDAAEHQVQQHHQLQEGHQQHHQQYRNSTLFEEIVGSVPEYKEDEIQLTKEYMIAINNAAEYWTKKGEHQKIHDAIASCIKKNKLIQMLNNEKKELRKHQQQLQKMVKEAAYHKNAIQLDMYEEKSYMTKLQLENDQLLAEKISYLEIINEKEAVISLLRDQKLAQELQSEEDKVEEKEGEAEKIKSRKPDSSFPEAETRAQKRKPAKKPKEPAKSKKRAKGSFLQWNTYQVYNMLDELSQEKLRNYWKSSIDGTAFWQGTSILFKDDIQSLLRDTEIYGQIIDAYAEILHDDEKKDPARQQNAYITCYAYADASNVFLNSVKECAPSILEKNSFTLLEFKKPVYNEEFTDEIAKLLPNLKVTPAIAQTIQYLMKHDPTKFNFKEDRECAQQPQKSNDCGVFVMYYIQQLSQGKQIEESLSTAHVWEMRKEVLLKTMESEKSWYFTKGNEG